MGNINSHLKSKSLIGDHVKHLPYEKSARGPFESELEGAGLMFHK